MSVPIGDISGINMPAPVQVPSVAPAAGASFRQVLLDQIERIDALQCQADQAVTALAQGRTDDVGRVWLAQHRADEAFDALLRVHDTLQRAYEEIKQVNV